MASVLRSQIVLMLKKMAVKEQSKTTLRMIPLEYKQHNCTISITTRCQNELANDIIQDGTIGSAHFLVLKLLQKLSMKVKY